jgi:hypothetical protein
MFDHKHYVPILKAKRGEFWALSNLKNATKEKVTPLLDFLPHGTKSLAEIVPERMEQISDAWGTRPLFLDTRLVTDNGSISAQGIAEIFDAAAASNLHAIPVTSPSHPQTIHTRVAAIVAQQNHGAALRLKVADFNNPQTLATSITTVLTRLHLQPNRVDVIIDYEATSPDAALQLIRAHTGVLPSLNRWRTYTVTSGSFPQVVSDLAQNQWHQLPRNDWAAWLGALTNAPALARKPSYGDYGIRDTSLPRSGRANANIRYTADTYFLIRRGRQVQEGHAGDIRAICASLIARAEYSGVAFSEGDDCINQVINPPTTTGGAEQWTQWGMNHHIEKVVWQIANHNGL